MLKTVRFMPPEMSGRRAVMWLVPREDDDGMVQGHKWKHVGWLMPAVAE